MKVPPQMCSRLWEKLRREEGQDAIEYVLAASMIALLSVAGMKHIATHINTAYGNVATHMNLALSSGGGGDHGGGGDQGGGDHGGGHGGHGGH